MQAIENLKKQGFDVQNGKILSATPERVKNFTSCGKVFKTQQDDKGNILKRGWTPVTKAEAKRLKQVIDPVTKRPYVKFAYVPIPKEQLQPENERIDEIDDLDTNIVDGIPVLNEPNETVKAAGSTDETDSFDDFENDQNEAAGLEAGPGETEENTDKGLTAEDVERKELMLKTKKELVKIVKDDLGMEIPSKATKEELVEMIVG